jgi:hypothetical protein
MTEQTTPTEVTQPGPMQPAPTEAANQPATAKPTQRAISDPREVAAVVMARMKLVSAKKDEMSLAITGLVDITQQLTRAYGEQLIAIEQLRRRVRELEAAAATAPPALPQ